MSEVKLNGFWYKPDDKIARMTLSECLDHAEYAIAWDERGDSITTLNDCITRIRDLTRWIPVTERLPTKEDATKNGWVLWHLKKEFVVCSFYDVRIADNPHLTHWRRIDTPEGA